MPKQVRGVTRRAGEKIWRFDFVVRGHRFCGSTETADRREAERIVLALREEKRREVAQLDGRAAMSFGAAATRWWTESAQHRKDARDMERALAWMQTAIGASTPILRIDSNMLSRLVAKRRGEGVSNSTVNRSLVEPLRALLTRAGQEWGQAVAKIAWKRHKLREPPGRVRVMTDDERRRLFACLDVRFWPLAKFILATGLRRAEACGLLWSRVDLEASRITIPVKGGDVTAIPLSEAAALIIKSQSGLHPTHVFAYETRRLYGEGAGRVVPILPETFYTAFRRARDAAGLTNADLTVHDLRHTAISRTVAQTGNLAAAQRQAGHRNIRTTMRYAHLSDADVRAALDAADPITGPQEVPQKSRGAKV